MNWIRKNPHLVTLLVIALLLVSTAALVTLNARSFDDQFQGVISGNNPPPPARIPPLDYSVLDQAESELQKPNLWKEAPVYPFVSERMSIIDGRPQKSGVGSHYKDRLTQEPIPDAWFLKYGLPVTDANVPTLQSAASGFLNEDMWRGNLNTGNRVSLDPTKKEPHPPYYTKLFLKARDPVRFRLRFNGYDGDPEKDKPEDMTYQINTVDRGGATKFVKIGEKIEGTAYVVKKFAYKRQVNPNTGADDEVSILTVENAETKESVDLIKGQIVDSPDVYAIFTYLWPKQQRTDFRVKRLGKFGLLPDKGSDQLYMLVDIMNDHATIKTPSGEEVKIVPMPPWYQP